MKAVIEFNLPDEDEEFRQAVAAIDLMLTINDFDNYLRGIVKYNKSPFDGEASEGEIHIAQKIRERLWEIIQEHDVSGIVQ